MQLLKDDAVFRDYYWLILVIDGNPSGDSLQLQGDQKVSVHLMITIQKVTSNVQSVPRHLQTFIDTPNCVLEDRVQYRTVYIPNVNSDGHLQFISYVGNACFLNCNHQVHRDFLITLYIDPDLYTHLSQGD
jgi:hypothetical protein